ncbi:MAG: PEP-CTERM sorting domain-containing protein [Planctomycetota bacterium]|nr:PEP-CTERM sorting domain-containing protein [Planctomycetota bacterium]
MPPTNRILRIGFIVFFCAVAAPVASGALSVGINFAGKTSFSGSAMGPGEWAGVEPQAFWNNAPNGTGTLSALLDSAGAATGVSVTWRGTGSYQSAVPNNPGDQRLMRGLITNLGPDPATLTVTGLAALFPNGYDVLVYFDGSNAGTAWTTDFSVNSQVLRGTDVPTTDFAGTFVRDTGAGGNYVRFTYIQGDTLAISAAPQAGSTATINAIQLIHAPEPATLGLLGFGAASCLLARRKRR